MGTQALTPFLCRKGENLHDGASSKDDYRAETELDRLVRELCVEIGLVMGRGREHESRRKSKTQPKTKTVRSA